MHTGVMTQVCETFSLDTFVALVRNSASVTLLWLRLLPCVILVGHVHGMISVKHVRENIVATHVLDTT